MSTIRGKQKNTVEEDFEAFVRRQFNSISDNMKEVKGRIVCNCVNNQKSVCLFTLHRLSRAPEITAKFYN